MSDTPSRRSNSTLAALLIGLPTAAGVLALFHYGPLRHTPAFRYLEWPTQWVEAAFFCTGLGALAVRLWALRGEQAALGRDLLPRWDGKPVGVDKAGDLLAALRRQPAATLDTYLGRRLATLLGFVSQRKTAAGLDDQMRALADADALHHDAGLGFIRFITWAIPILGFLGTVVGITGAIGGATAEQLETNMSKMTDGLAEAFDATALALGCTMALMFLNFLVERQEQSLLAAVDDETDRALAHRFRRDAAEAGSSVADAVRDQGRMIAEALHAF
ncbi:MAG: MotA/TolQ/ExbB proton channel family protein, partial [Gemmataceae bacterium]